MIARGGKVRRESADHKDVAVGKVDQAHNSVHHRIAQGHQSVDKAQPDAIYKKLRKQDGVLAGTARQPHHKQQSNSIHERALAHRNRQAVQQLLHGRITLSFPDIEQRRG